MEINSQTNCVFALINNNWQCFWTPNMTWIVILTLLLAGLPWTGSCPLSLSFLICKIKQEEDLSSQLRL